MRKTLDKGGEMAYNRLINKQGQQGRKGGKKTMKRYVNVVFWGREPVPGNSEEFDTLTEAREYARDYGGQAARAWWDGNVCIFCTLYPPAREKRTNSKKKD